LGGLALRVKLEALVGCDQSLLLQAALGMMAREKQMVVPIGRAHLRQAAHDPSDA